MTASGARGGWGGLAARLGRLTLALGLALAGGCGAADRAPKAPPPPQDEPRPLKPGSDVFWETGRWVWDPGPEHFYWEPGRWERARSGKVWVPGYWRPVGEGQDKAWEWVPDRWESAR